ncbi:MAG: hypothetical protein K9M14_04790, partial [Candidatus Omnitrophica bacterium]|nr:hypothetical protein [Candidatus Omnitrophota bacterium]
IVADYKKKYKAKIPLIAVVTDFHPHRFWVHSSVDRYVVASQEAKQTLIKEGVDSDKIFIFGIPISIKFMGSSDREEIAKKFGFFPRLKAVLVMGGGLGIGPIEEIIANLDRLDYDFQIIGVCGKNRILYRKLEKIKKKTKKPLFVFSYIECIDKIMDFCDIIITKAGGVTIAEALCKKLAIIIAKPIPGQEELNVDFLIRKKAVIKTDDFAQINKSVAELIKNPDKLNFFKKSAGKTSLGNSSAQIADLVLERIQ